MYLKTEFELINLNTFSDIYTGSSEDPDTGKITFWVFGDNKYTGETMPLVACESEEDTITILEDITSAIGEGKELLIIEGE